MVDGGWEDGGAGWLQEEDALCEPASACWALSTQAAQKTSVFSASTEHAKEVSLALAGPPCAPYQAYDLPLSCDLRRAQGPTSAGNTAAMKAAVLSSVEEGSAVS